MIEDSDLRIPDPGLSCLRVNRFDKPALRGRPRAIYHSHAHRGLCDEFRQEQRNQRTGEAYHGRESQKGIEVQIYTVRRK